SHLGLQKGSTTRVTVRGANFGDDGELFVPIEGIGLKRLEGSSAEQLVLEVTVPDDCTSGLYPVRVRTKDGVSNPLVVAVDELPQHPVNAAAADKPARLPAAFFGRISGGEQPRIYFQGHAGMRLV